MKYLNFLPTASTPFPLGIADLRFDNVADDNGIRLARTLIGHYSSKYGVAARIGTVTAHGDEFAGQFQNGPFVFKYSKSELRDDSYRRFVSDMKYNIAMSKIDMAASEYSRKKPPKVDRRRFDHIHTLFGYVARIGRDLAWLRIWDPLKLGSESTRRYKYDFLAQRGIRYVGQPVRICTFVEKTKAKGLLQLTEPIGTILSDWVPAVTDFDPSRFD